MIEKLKTNLTIAGSNNNQNDNRNDILERMKARQKKIMGHVENMNNSTFVSLSNDDNEDIHESENNNEETNKIEEIGGNNNTSYNGNVNTETVIVMDENEIDGNGNNSSVNKEGAENGIDGNGNNSSVNNNGAENDN